MLQNAALSPTAPNRAVGAPNAPARPSPFAPASQRIAGEDSGEGARLCVELKDRPCAAMASLQRAETGRQITPSHTCRIGRLRRFAPHGLVPSPSGYWPRRPRVFLQPVQKLRVKMINAETIGFSPSRCQPRAIEPSRQRSAKVPGPNHEQAAFFPSLAGPRPTALICRASDAGAQAAVSFGA